MNIDSIGRQLKKSYKRNAPELNAYLKGLYPNFVFDRQAKTLDGEIPVFTFHSVEPVRFEEQLQFLAINKYKTLTADEFYRIIIGKERIPENAVLLTFDDGLGSVWSVAYPLLKKYGFVAVCFIVPGCVVNEKMYFPNLNDYWEGKGLREEVLSRESTRTPFCTWQEIEIMHNSGVVDFQSHTMYHNLEFTSSNLVDYIHPNFTPGYNNHRVPIFSIDGSDHLERNAEFGTPIYTFKPRMAGVRRYFDDENLRKKCIEFVMNKNGKDFFKSPSWRKKIGLVVENYIANHDLNGYYEANQKVGEKIYKDLYESKQIIEEKLPGKIVNHLCYPWFVGSELSVEMSIKAGYLTNFWGILSQRRTNRQGNDPYRIVRLREQHIHRLPGKGRKALFRIFEDMFLMNYKGFINKLFNHD